MLEEHATALRCHVGNGLQRGSSRFSYGQLRQIDGVVSERDLFALQRVGLRKFAKRSILLKMLKH